MKNCKYCNGRMMQQDTDPLPGGYSTLFVCVEGNCKSVYEKWYDRSHIRTPEKDQWFNPTTKEFKK